MKAVKVHFQTDLLTCACGFHCKESTKVRKEVTCLVCQGTRAFRAMPVPVPTNVQPHVHSWRYAFPNGRRKWSRKAKRECLLCGREETCVKERVEIIRATRWRSEPARFSEMRWSGWAVLVEAKFGFPMTK